MKSNKIFGIIGSAGAGSPSTLTITAALNDNVAEFTVTGYISEWNKASARAIEEKVATYIADGITDATIYISSQGGSTIEAAEIFNVIARFKGKKIAIGGALVGSAAGWLACKCDEFHVHKNTQFMWHKPSGVFQGNADEIDSDVKLLRNTEKDYLAVYSEKTGKSTEDLNEQWSKGDQWLMGEEIVTEGFADKVVDSNATITESDTETLEAVGAPVVPVATIQKRNQKKDKMSKINYNLIGLNANATDAEVEAKLKELKSKADEADALRKAQAEAESKAQAKAIATIINGAIKDKKISAAQTEQYEAILKADFENGKAVIEALNPIPKLSEQAKGGEAKTGRKDWTFADWQNKDPEGLAELHKNSPKEFDKLFENQK